MPSTDVEQVKARLDRLRGQWGRISRESGVPYTTIKNLMQGLTKDPRSSTINTLRNYLRREIA